MSVLASALAQIAGYSLIRPRSKAKYLAEKFGGKWKYDGVGSWNCDDKKRWVSRTLGCICDDVCEHPRRYYLYGDGTPKIVCFV